MSDQPVTYDLRKAMLREAPRLAAPIEVKLHAMLEGEGIELTRHAVDELRQALGVAVAQGFRAAVAEIVAQAEEQGLRVAVSVEGRPPPSDERRAG
jgi:hypothetical protein